MDDTVLVLEDVAMVKSPGNPNKPVTDPDLVLGNKSIAKMKAIEFREALKKRGMSTNGNKPTLFARLKEGNTNEVTIVKERPVAQIENCAGDAFELGSYWKLL